MDTAKLIVSICARFNLFGEAAALIKAGKSVEDAKLLVARERAYRRIRRRSRWCDAYWRV